MKHLINSGLVAMVAACLVLGPMAQADNGDAKLVFKDAKSYAVRANGELLITDGKEVGVLGGLGWVLLPSLANLPSIDTPYCGVYTLKKFTNVFSVAEDISGNIYAAIGHDACAGERPHSSTITTYSSIQVAALVRLESSSKTWGNKLIWEVDFPISIVYDKNNAMYVAAGNRWAKSDNKGVAWSVNVTNPDSYSKSRIYADAIGGLYLASLGGVYTSTPRGGSLLQYCEYVRSTLRLGNSDGFAQTVQIPDYELPLPVTSNVPVVPAGYTLVNSSLVGWYTSCKTSRNSADLSVLAPGLIVDSAHRVFSINSGSSWVSLASGKDNFSAYMAAKNGDIYALAKDGMYAIASYDANAPSFGYVIRRVISFTNFQSIEQVRVQANGDVYFIGQHVDGVSGLYRDKISAPSNRPQATQVSLQGARAKQTVTVDFAPDSADEGKLGNIFVFVEFGGATYLKTGKNWFLFGKRLTQLASGELLPLEVLTGKNIDIAVDTDLTPLKGAKIKIAYGVGHSTTETLADMSRSARPVYEFVLD